MLTPFLIAGFVMLMAGLFGSRFVAERATKLLSSEEKLALLDSFSRLRVFGALPAVFIVFLFFGIRYLPQVWMWPAYFVGFALFAIYFAIMHRIVSRRLSELGINASYRAAYSKARWVSYSGWFAFFLLNTISPFVSR
jgi:hypothetical protein